ncbi:MAG: hypothetical protein A2X34_08285 [Elusimicrobia bacterium GWC2_51_8]|nr:MAG: hypothetical protein A2X33_02455 [Elusimicrobia bacterium GWA2_51_34]OGR59346.1 MAG: hypothetical protein A2X34_08285 [Elusimicrobia bacterium GWC2_51_8]OGR86975.1 MAG: hypothetical protein A2021_01425 [Elusimicrobia bacterium GWF2_52_66]HAF96573.1 hypothetical protein [Elusimicrobiota bacterium]HCE98201.1 hypothetical protein [Elusimicrobiota bacterium]
MELIEEFFKEFDRLWRPHPAKKIPLQIIGSTALMLQAGYERGTKDSDILETASIIGPVGKKLLSLAGKNSDLNKRYGIYLDIVGGGIPFFPLKPVFNALPVFGGLKNFEITALDITDVVVSKLKRFTSNDAADIRAVVEKGLVRHALLVSRFRAAVDAYSLDARAEDLPLYIRNLHTVERDFLEVVESEIELPGWM